MKPIFECENLVKSYDDRKVLDGISLRAMPGERLALTGPSGSGKSTLLNCLGAVDHVDSGTIRFDGQALESASPDELSRLRRTEISTVFQFFHLLPTLSVLENTAFPLLLNGVAREEANRRAAEWAEKVGLSHRVHALPGELSGGEMQRCAIARALVHEPRLLLADEPTGNLDSKTGELILDLLEDVVTRTGTTLVMVTHSVEATRIVNRVLKVLDGRIVEEDPA